MYCHLILEFIEEIELENLNQAWKSMQEFLEESISKEDQKIIFTEETEKKRRTCFVVNPVAFLFAVPALLHKDTLNQNLPFKY